MRMTRWFFFFSLCSAPIGVQADEDLFALPSPTPVFLSDHFHDNEDVDGTRLKKKDGSSSKEEDIDFPHRSAKDDAAISVLNEHQMPEAGAAQSEVGAPVKGNKEKEAIQGLGMEKPPSPTPTPLVLTPTPTPDDL